jgi:hypothetical protein
MARLESTAKAGYYPMPPSVVERITALIRPAAHSPRQAVRLLDPRCGTGAALRLLTDAVGVEAVAQPLRCDLGLFVSQRFGYGDTRGLRDGIRVIRKEATMVRKVMKAISTGDVEPVAIARKVVAGDQEIGKPEAEPSSDNTPVMVTKEDSSRKLSDTIPSCSLSPAACRSAAVAPQLCGRR